MACEFFLEIGCEEIPAWMIRDALAHLAGSLRKALADAQLPVGEPWSSATPRRLAVLLTDLPERQSDRTEEVLGPPAAIAADAAGAWTKAALGFAAKQGVAAAELRLMDTPKGRYAGFTRGIAGRSSADVLAELLPDLVKGIPFPKTMYWREDRFRFIRPIRNLLALLDGRVVPFEVAGVASGDSTFGHRFLGEPRIVVHHFEDYREQLRRNRIILDWRERQAKIQSELAALEAGGGVKVAPDPALLEVVTFLNELPTVLTGTFDERFLAIPQEVLVTVMRKHQKYFSLTDGKGVLLPRFAAVINMEADPRGLIRQGHERVLKARLVDAEFFWNNDRRAPLADRVPGLANVLFQESLGSYLEKTGRLEQLVVSLCGWVRMNAEKTALIAEAARLCKADLATEMVKELTELQGVMGGLYCRQEGRPAAVWRAVYEHYRPEGTDDALPTCLEGTILSLADKADTVTGMLGLGFMPTGSRDPFGLRRQAAGIYRLILEKGMDFDLRALFEHARELLAGRLTVAEEPFWAAVREFLEGRVRFYYQAAGFRYDEINAVIERAVWRPLDALQRLEALKEIRPVAAFASIFTAKKRIQNILGKLREGIGTGFADTEAREPEEIQLLAVVRELETPIREAIGSHDYAGALRLIERFARPIDAFFDKVLVMHEDPAIRNNRLLLLGMVGDLFDAFCDFSKFVLEERERSLQPH